MCNCKNITPASPEAFAQQIVLPIPPHMSKYSEAREKAGLDPTVCIDPCIVDEIQDLWSKGIITYGCCCGHNLHESFVNVDNSHVELMISLGYKMNHEDKTRKDTFKLKSA